MFRCDQEPALTDLLNAAAQHREGTTIQECSPVASSKTTGRAERAVQTLDCAVRVSLKALEQKLRAKVSVQDAVLAWLVEHSADLYNKFHADRAGRTAYQRVKGRPYHGERLPFGAKIWHRTAGKVSGGVMAARWHEGLWLGKTFASDEHIVSMPNGDVVRARSVRYFPEGGSGTRQPYKTTQGNRGSRQRP